MTNSAPLSTDAVAGPSSRELALGVLLPGFAGEAAPTWLLDRLSAGLAGACLFGENVTPALGALVAALRTAAPDALLAIDEEGGDVTRLHGATGSDEPGNAVLGRIDDPGATRASAARIAAAVRAAGLDLDFAPVVDVNSNPRNPVIGARSFGADAALVARHTTAWISGAEGAGVATSAKHFPGHGDVAVDSHLALPVLDAPLEELRARELVPFAAAVAAGARTVMTSHIVVREVDPERPATFSPAVLEGLLRDELGFRGVIVSDALDMAGASAETGIPEAAVRALLGGCDLLCLGTRNTGEQVDAIADAIVAAVASGRLPRARLEAAATRVAALRSALAAERSEVSSDGVAVDPGGEGEAAGPAEGLSAERIRAAFAEYSSATATANARLVQLETTANVAVGSIPWGIAAVRDDVARVREGDPLPDGPVVLVGRDLHRYPWIAELVRRTRAERDALVVDMGWPDPEAGLADLATFGASRAVAAALVEHLGLGGEA